MGCPLKNRLAECLTAKGITKSQLARRLRMSRAYVTRLEGGEIGPSLEAALKIARYFGKPVEEIFQLVEGASSPVNTFSRPSPAGLGIETTKPPGS